VEVPVAGKVIDSVKEDVAVNVRCASENEFVSVCDLCVTVKCWLNDRVLVSVRMRLCDDVPVIVPTVFERLPETAGEKDSVRLGDAEGACEAVPVRLCKYVTDSEAVLGLGDGVTLSDIVCVMDSDAVGDLELVIVREGPDLVREPREKEALDVHVSVSVAVPVCRLGEGDKDFVAVNLGREKLRVALAGDRVPLADNSYEKEYVLVRGGFCVGDLVRGRVTVTVSSSVLLRRVGVELRVSVGELVLPGGVSVLVSDADSIQETEPNVFVSENDQERESVGEKVGERLAVKRLAVLVSDSDLDPT
jgi:hypothetical protein